MRAYAALALRLAFTSDRRNARRTSLRRSRGESEIQISDIPPPVRCTEIKLPIDTCTLAAGFGTGDSPCLFRRSSSLEALSADPRPRAEPVRPTSALRFCSSSEHRWCRGTGVRRMVFRRFRRPTPLAPIGGLEPRGCYRGNPVMDFSGMEVTHWSFEVATCRSLSLFADGTLGTSYLLTETEELRRTA